MSESESEAGDRPDLLTSWAALGRYLRVNKDTAKHLVASGQIPAGKLPRGGIRVLKSECEKWLRNDTPAAPVKTGHRRRKHVRQFIK